MALPVIAKAAAVAIPVALTLVLTSKAKAKKIAGQKTEATLNQNAKAIRAAQLGLADELDSLVPAFSIGGGPEASFLGGVANRIRSRTTGTGFGDPAQGKLFDPGPDLAQGGQFAGAPASTPLRELQGLLMMFLGDGTKLVGWSQAMGSMGFVNYARQLREKAEGKASGGGGASQPSSPTTPGGGTVVPDFGARIAQVLATQDPAQILALADELARANFDAATVAQLRKIANDLQEARRVADELRRKAEEAAKPEPGDPSAPSPVPPFVPPAPTPGGGGTITPPAPGPAPTPAPRGVARIVVVQKGESPARLAQIMTGNEQRFRELVAANVPPKKRDNKSGGFTVLNPGEQLNVPPSWPDHARAVPKGSIGPTPVTPSPAIPTPVSPAPTPSGLRRVKVKPGEGPIKIATRLFGDADQGNLRWRELVAANVPPKKRDAKSGNFTVLNPGELLNIPPTWQVVESEVHRTGATA